MRTSAYSFSEFPSVREFAATAGLDDEEASPLLSLIEELMPAKDKNACTMATMVAFAIDESILSYADIIAALDKAIKAKQT